MAEAAVGLAFGTIALASLFSTCIDLLEFFELKKGYEDDYDLNCLKLSLLKSRLDSWGRDLRIIEVGHEASPLRDRWAQEQETVMRSLLGIKNLLGNADLLRDKYELLPNRPPAFMSLLTVRTKPRPSSDPKTETPASRKLGPRQRSFLRLSTTWAIRDKQKFDGLLSDLEFFISNLEHVIGRLAMSKQPRRDSGVFGVKASDNLNDNVAEKSQRSGSNAGRSFEVEKMYDQAVNIAATQRDGKEIPNTSNRNETYKIGEMRQNTTSMQGQNSEQSIRDVLDARNKMAANMQSRDKKSTSQGDAASNFSGLGRSISGERT